MQFLYAKSYVLCFLFEDLIQNGQLSFQMLNSLDCLYKEEYEEDENVRELWYLFCYHFLPKINKNWKLGLEGTRILKKLLCMRILLQHLMRQ
jgi:hypothetical protein